MIKRIHMKNYKCFPELDLSLAELTILAGANASGKSSIVQAILLSYATVREKGNTVDLTNALHIPVGSPQALIAQNPIDLDDADFSLEMEEEGRRTLISYKIDRYSPLKLLFQKENNFLESKVFYLNAERIGPRISYPAGGDENILSNGANAAYLIEQADMNHLEVSEQLRVFPEAGKFSIQVEGWMNVILGDLSFSVNTDLIKANTDIRYGNSLVDRDVLPTMTGFGISYILSIVVAGLWSATIENAVLIIENPEAHLHPAAQSRMGKFLQMLSAAGVQVIIETHSEHIIDGVRIQSAWMKRNNQIKVSFFSVENGKIGITDLSVNSNGELDRWPKGFFDQKGQDLRELLEIRRANAGK